MRKIKIMDADGSIKSPVDVRLAICLLLLILLVTFTPSDSPGVATVNGFRQELWAVTGALPTSGLTGGDRINVGSSQFTFPAGSPLSLAGNNLDVRLPYLPPANTLGIWVYVEIDGVEQAGMFLGWMANSEYGNTSGFYNLQLPNNPTMPDLGVGMGRFMAFSKKGGEDVKQFPANTVVKIYRAGI